MSLWTMRLAFTPILLFSIFQLLKLCWTAPKMPLLLHLFMWSFTLHLTVMVGALLYCIWWLPWDS